MLTRTTASWAAALAGAAAMLLAACGSDDEPVADTAAGVDVETWCAAVEVLDGAELPTLEMLDAYRTGAPEELADEIDLAFPTFAEALETGDFAPLGEPEVLAATETMRQVESEVCGTTPSDEDEGAAGVRTQLAA